MRKVCLSFILISAVVLLAAALTAPAWAQTGLQGDPVAHGKYLATIAGCGGCHTPLKPDGTPDETLPLAGGQEVDAVPANKLNAPVVQYVEISKPPAGPSLGQIALTIVGFIVVAVGVVVMVVMSRRANKR